MYVVHTTVVIGVHPAGCQVSGAAKSELTEATTGKAAGHSVSGPGQIFAKYGSAGSIN